MPRVALGSAGEGHGRSALQFGVLVTTSYVHVQAYQEIREDDHPVVILAGRDVVEILKRSGYDTVAAVSRFLNKSYPLRQEAGHQI
jgi:hypothetical protein